MKRKFLVQQVLDIMDIRQYEMAKFMKVNRSAVSKWVTGVDHFDDARVFQLKYYVDKNIGKKQSDLLFKEVIKEIES
jgi:plasmid maintenance system antidote protein VapI